MAGPAASQHPVDDHVDLCDAEAFDVLLDATVYQAALATRGTHVAPSLLDFLR